MSESTSETSVAKKRKALQDAGFPVGSRGKLSAEAEARYAELQTGQVQEQGASVVA